MRLGLPESPTSIRYFESYKGSSLSSISYSFLANAVVRQRFTMPLGQATEVEHSRPDNPNESNDTRPHISSMALDSTSDILQNRILPGKYSSSSRKSNWISQNLFCTERNFKPQHPTKDQSSPLVLLPILGQSNIPRNPSQEMVESQITDFAMRCHVPSGHGISVEELEEMRQRAPSAFDIRLSDRIRRRNRFSPTAHESSSKELISPSDTEFGMGLSAGGKDISASSPRVPPVTSSINAIASSYSNIPVNYAKSIISCKSRSSTVESTSSSLSIYSSDSLDSGIYMAPQDLVKRQRKYICNICSTSCADASQLLQHGRRVHGAENFCDFCFHPAFESVYVSGSWVGSCCLDLSVANHF